jgi:hypothetical protein
MGGLLLSVGSSDHASGKPSLPPTEFVYRLDESGRLVYRLPLPQYEGALHDDMVLGGDQRGFATRGGVLIAFNVEDGHEVWRWDGKTLDIEVLAALANGGCLVQTPTALLEVDNSFDVHEIMKGKAALDWRGQLYRKSD